MASAGTSGAQITSDRYLDLVERGLIGADDRVELLEGVIVSMAPQDPAHAYSVGALQQILQRGLGARALVRAQMPLLPAPTSMPEPEIAVVSGRLLDYVTRHPATAERRYAETSRAERGERLALGAFPDVTVPVDAILPPP